MGEWMQVVVPEELQARMHNVRPNPPHRGRVLRCIRFEDPRSIPVAADQRDVECGELERVIDGKAPITPELALRTESVWHARAGLWLDLQADYDLVQARCHNATA